MKCTLIWKSKNTVTKAIIVWLLRPSRHWESYVIPYIITKRMMSYLKRPETHRISDKHHFW